jgi:hypothetical protein
LGGRIVRPVFSETVVEIIGVHLDDATLGREVDGEPLTQEGGELAQGFVVLVLVPDEVASSQIASLTAGDRDRPLVYAADGEADRGTPVSGILTLCEPEEAT